MMHTQKQIEKEKQTKKQVKKKILVENWQLETMESILTPKLFQIMRQGLHNLTSSKTIIREK